MPLVLEWLFFYWYTVIGVILAPTFDGPELLSFLCCRHCSILPMRVVFTFSGSFFIYYLYEFFIELSLHHDRKKIWRKQALKDPFTISAIIPVLIVLYIYSRSVINLQLGLRGIRWLWRTGRAVDPDQTTHRVSPWKGVGGHHTTVSYAYPGRIYGDDSVCGKTGKKQITPSKIL